jgi:hypothetical protein
LNEGSRRISRRHREGLFSAISAGFFLVLIGMLFVTIPGLSDKIVAFFRDFNVIQVPHLEGVSLLGPQNPRAADALAVYSAAMRFSLVWAIFLTAMLGARFVVSSPKRRSAQNLGDLVFWFGAAYLIQNLLIDVDSTEWFGFWAAIIVLFGVSLIVRAIFLAVVSLRSG